MGLSHLKKPPYYTLQRLEFLILLTLIGIAFAFARPQLEGWGVFEVFRVNGLSAGFWQLVGGNPARLLEPVPLAMAWSLGHGAIWALALIFAMELVAQYLIARWALSPWVSGVRRCILATLAATMLPWSGQWHCHNMAQQLAVLCLLVALGALLRLRQKFSLTWFLIGTLSVLFSLFAYEALILCVLALPCVVLFFNPENPHRSYLPKAMDVALPALFGLLLYGLFFFLNNHWAAGKTYHAILISGPLPLYHPVKLLTYLYRTLYIRFPLTSIFFVGVIVWLNYISSFNLQVKQRVVFTLVLLLALPLLALPYAVNFYFLSDIERVGFPVGFGGFLVSAVIIARNPVPTRNRLKNIDILVLIAILTWATLDAYKNYRPYQLQRTLLDQTEALLRKYHTSNAILRDWTGLFGDFYTFLYPSTLQQAIAVEGLPNKINLCTPNGVLKHHPMMRQFEGSSEIPICEGLPSMNKPQFVFDIRKTADRLPIVHFSRIQLSNKHFYKTSIIKGSKGGLEANKLWWINQPYAIISVKNQTNKNAVVTWNGTFIPTPCTDEHKIRITIDGQSVFYQVKSPTSHSFSTQLNGGEEKLAYLYISGPRCVLKDSADRRAFYVGITTMNVN